LPSSIKIGDAGKGGKEIDLAGGSSNHILESLMRKVVLCDFEERNPELPECACHPDGIFPGGFDSEIDVLGVARLGVVDDGVGSNHEILNLLFGEDAQ
jgi:hypothetical protein